MRLFAETHLLTLFENYLLNTNLSIFYRLYYTKNIDTDLVYFGLMLRFRRQNTLNHNINDRRTTNEPLPKYN